MNKIDLMRKTLLAGLVASAFGLAGCSAEGNNDGSGSSNAGGSGNGGPIDNGSGNNGLANDGSTPTVIWTDTNGDGVADTPVVSGKGFVCTKVAADVMPGATTAVGANGLIGNQLNGIIGQLGGATVAGITNGVVDPNYVIDGDLATYATMQAAANALTPQVNSIDLSVVFPGSVPAGGFAVFGLTFPAALAVASVQGALAVTTYDANGNQQETIPYNSTTISLANNTLTGGSSVWLGFQTKKPYERATLSVTSQLLSVNASVQAHEFCADGNFVTPP